MFYTRLKDICKSKGTTLTAVLKSLGISTSSTGTWKKGALPSGENLIALSTHLNVSVDYLLFGKDENSTSISSKSDLLPDEHNLLNTYREMDSVGKKLLQDQLKYLWAEHHQPSGKLSISHENNCG